MTVDVSEEGILVKPKVHRPRNLGLPYGEQQLLQGLNATTAHADELAPLLQAELRAQNLQETEAPLPSDCVS